MAPARPERSGVRRLVAAWRALAREQRVVALAAAVLLLTMLLPWYSRTVNAVVGGKLTQQAELKQAITVFSLVEAAIFLVALGVTILVLARGDGRAFHLPGGDGTVVTGAGAWATFLIFYRFVDKPDGGGNGQQVVEYGLSWGIFFGLLAALALLVSGLRLRGAGLVEPALPGSVAPSDGPISAAPRPRADPAPPVTAETRVAAPADPEAQTRAARRAERERRRADAGTPVRDRRPPRPAPDQAPTSVVPAPGGAADDAPTDVEPPRPTGSTGSFEPPEFELPPHRRRRRDA